MTGILVGSSCQTVLFKHKTEAFKLASCFLKTQNASVETQFKAKQATIMHELKDTYYAQSHKTLRATTDTPSTHSKFYHIAACARTRDKWMSSHYLQEVWKKKV